MLRLSFFRLERRSYEMPYMNAQKKGPALRLDPFLLMYRRGVLPLFLRFDFA
jgi:hypothetical protein